MVGQPGAAGLHPRKQARPLQPHGHNFRPKALRGGDVEVERAFVGDWAVADVQIKAIPASGIGAGSKPPPKIGAFMTTMCHGTSRAGV